MDTKVSELRFVRTYNIAQGIRDLVIENDPKEFLLDYFEINDYFIERALKPKKKSLLHWFINEFISNDFEYEARKWPDSKEWNEMTNKYLGLEIDADKFEEDSEYVSNWETLISKKILPRIGDEVFFLLFNDREFLYYFNKLISQKIVNLKQQDYPNFLNKDGVVIRSTYWPKWLTKAIFYRDKGTCCSCTRDISNLLNTGNKIHLDHVIALNRGGTNDTSNIQLLCEKCNLKKKDKLVKGNYFYYKHY